MVKYMNDVLDEIDRAILTCLTQDARVSLKVLGASGADLAEHRRAGEAPGGAGVIQGLWGAVNLAALGYSLQALVRVRPLLGCCRRWINISVRCRNVLKVTR